MTHPYRETGLGWPGGSEPVSAAPAGELRPAVAGPAAPGAGGPGAGGPGAGGPGDDARPGRPAGTPDPSPPAPRRRASTAGVVIAVLLALLGFTLAVQVKNVSGDPTLGAARQDDLVRILSDLEAREQRLRSDIADLESSLQQLASGEQGRRAALEEATRRADELGILAGTLPARGPGVVVRFRGESGPIKARAVLDAVQELRGAGAEALQIGGADGTLVRIIASTYVLPGGDGGIDVDGRRLTGPYTIWAIGDPQTLRPALNIPGGVVETVDNDGGTVIVEDAGLIDVTALHEPIVLRYARPVS